MACGALVRRKGLGLGSSFRRLSSQVLDVFNNVAESTSQEGGSLLARYQTLLASGTLKPDTHQAACIQRLDKLCTELGSYKESIAAYQLELATYKRARQERWQEVYEQEERRFSAEEPESNGGANGSGSGGRTASLIDWVGAGPEQKEEAGSKQMRLSHQQRRTIVSARAERRLDELLGPAPPPPPAPKGVYLHGSVGSGKSLLMDLLYTTVAQPHHHNTPSPDAPGGPSAGALPYHRRLHFNSALLELHSRLHELDKHQEGEGQRALEAYAAAQQVKRGAAAVEQGGGMLQAAWQQIRDPITEKIKRSKLAKLAYRRMMRDKASRSVEEHSHALAQSNAAVLRHAARALIRNCDTLSLLQHSTRGSGPAEIREGEGEEDEDGPPEAGRIAALLCFDEMQVNDVFNAVALKGLMEALIDEGCVVVATSNRAPWELNRHGLHEDLFSHYVDRLLESCDVIRLDAEQDYRRLLGGPRLLAPAGAAAAAQGQAQQAQTFSYFYPLGPHSQQGMRREWEAVGAAGADAAGKGEGEGQGGAVRVMFGRSLEVRRRRGGAAWFEFEELCGRPLGAPDFLAISQEFHTVFLEGVPAMSMKLRDRARRFITLVDELYNHRVRLVCSAEVAPDELFMGAQDEEPIIDLESLQFETEIEGSKLRRNLMADGSVAPVASTPEAAKATAYLLGGAEEKFAFARAVSRLYEMQGELYLASRPRQ